MSIRVGRRAMARVVGPVDICPEDVEMVLAVSSAYNLCTSGPAACIIISLSSEYFMCVPGEEAVTISITSTYSLSTAVT